MERIVLSVGCGHDGRLGHGGDRNESVPRRLAFFDSKKEVRSVAAGGYHTFFVCTDYVYSVGLNESGQLGIGSKQSYSLPRAVPNLVPDTIRVITLGRYHSVVVLNGGTALACGENKNGQLGMGDYDSRTYFGQIEALNSHRVITAAAGAFHTLFGVPSETNPLSMAVLTCGKGDSGELGYNPDAIHTLSRIDQRIKGTNWTLESTQQHQDFATSFTTTRPRQSGEKEERRLEVDCPRPYLIDIPFSLDISKTTLHAGFHHSCVICPPYAFHFGCRYDGQHETSTSSVALPLVTSDGRTPRAVVCGEEMLVLSNEEGSLEVMGRGLLGLEESDYTDGLTAVKAFTRCPEIVSGCARFIMAWEPLGTSVLSFGDNYMGQCGVGNETDIWTTPSVVQFPSECGRVIEVSCGVRHAVFLCERKEQR